MIQCILDMLREALPEIVGGLVVAFVCFAFKQFWPQWGKLIKDTLASLLCWRGSRIVAWAVVLILVGMAIRPLPPPHPWVFIINRSILTEICDNGAGLSVKPGEHLILGLATGDSTPVPSGVWSCHWNSLTGHIGNPDNCTDVTYQSPGNGTDIVGLTVNGGSVKPYQLSLSITVK